MIGPLAKTCNTVRLCIKTDSNIIEYHKYNTTIYIIAALEIELVLTAITIQNTFPAIFSQ